MLQTVADLMTADPFAVNSKSSLKDAHDLMREKNIRHIPVIDERGILQGMLTQKIMIAKVMGIMATYGPNALERKEKYTVIEDIMATDFASIQPNQNLAEVAEFFVSNRHGCMPVVDEQNKLLGILTSSDFVRLAAALLS
ncbi:MULTISPECIES: HPP family protein [Pseudoalteromonas]|uniref:CBS domain-containing protein n=1 Tax=Pseudoalteromonas amylolytica TaxID=1859457 RepID=A0A1S1MPT1_9GAMM|nr:MULTISPECIES: CBS domain-containing protein [Pseudoalteromonas]MCF6435303.1 CBS domain-containing protein [Pseudoalteromonas sp. MMG022]OHU88598.1 CBS domain-containing protein [Pseudoalteromonas sp. JW3]OHU90441.1 CBS domain-containing protein [Pseudoalteromonas amylolytica]